MRRIELTEFKSYFLPSDALSPADAEKLWQNYRQQIQVEPPSFKTAGQWHLTSQGWCGFIPLSSQLMLALRPKVPLKNLFGMISQVYELDELPFDDQLAPSNSLNEVVEQLAWLLAVRTQKLFKKGLKQKYVEAVEPLPYVAGRIDLASLANNPLMQQIVCQHERLTADIRENQILLWTLHLILQSRICSSAVENRIREVIRQLATAVSLRSCLPEAPLESVSEQRSSNLEYGGLMALCYFFLNHCGPGSQAGDQEVPSFLIPTARLFERYVARWLQRHLPCEYRLEIQERHAVGASGDLHFAIDMTLYEESKRQTVAVMDTKYKIPETTPSTADVAQVLAYAEITGAEEAILIYPATLPRPFDEQIGQIRVRALAFDLAQEFDTAGRNLLADIGSA